MKFIQGHNITQINLFPVSLDQSIDPENEVRMLEEYTRALVENDDDNRQLISDEITKQQKQKQQQTAFKKHICRILRKEPNKL